MTVKRLVGILFVFSCTSAAWFILGASMHARTADRADSLGQEVEALWGSQHRQGAPEIGRAHV